MQLPVHRLSAPWHLASDLRIELPDELFKVRIREDGERQIGTDDEAYAELPDDIDLGFGHSAVGQTRSLSPIRFVGRRATVRSGAAFENSMCSLCVSYCILVAR